MRGLEQALDLAWSQSVFRFQRDPRLRARYGAGITPPILNTRLLPHCTDSVAWGSEIQYRRPQSIFMLLRSHLNTPGRLDSMDRRGGLSYRVGFGKIYGSRNASERWMPFPPQYLLSLPERVFRSMSALSAGCCAS